MSSNTADRGIKSLDQRRAQHAWSVIEEVEGLDKTKQKEFGTLVRKLPMQILAASLGQALALLEAKETGKLGKALADWMQQRLPVAEGEQTDLLRRVIDGDADFLRFATAECLAYLTWLVRFADARGLTDATGS